jgi:hypothetical protein
MQTATRSTMSLKFMLDVGVLSSPSSLHLRANRRAQVHRVAVFLLDESHGR